MIEALAPTLAEQRRRIARARTVGVPVARSISCPRARRRARFGRRFDESLLVELDLVAFGAEVDPRVERCKQNPFADGCDDGVPIK